MLLKERPRWATMKMDTGISPEKSVTKFYILLTVNLVTNYCQ